MGFCVDVFLSDCRPQPRRGRIYTASEDYLIATATADFFFFLIMVDGMAQRLEVAGHASCRPRKFRDFSMNISALVSQQKREKSTVHLDAMPQQQLFATGNQLETATKSTSGEIAESWTARFGLCRFLQ